MALETLVLEHVPATHRIYVAFLKDVSNSEFLQSQLVARNVDFEYAFIDASSIISRLQALAAIYKGLTALLGGKLRTPNVHSEVVCALSPSSNIAESYRRWGISPTTKDVIVVKIVYPREGTSVPPTPPPFEAEEIWAHVAENVKGRHVPFTDEELASSTDWPKVRKYYKLNGVPGIEALKTDEDKRREMAVIALEAMALRGV